MIIIDTNSLLILVIGLIDPKQISKNKRTSIYDERDYELLCSVISNKELVVLPNIWTEVDNLLNKYFKGDYKESYIFIIVNLIKTSTEKYFESKIIENDYLFYVLGLTDTLILKCAKDCELLITSDSELAYYALSLGIKVLDLKAIKNEQFRGNQY